MKRLRNPYAGLDGFNCFGCSPANRMGLRMVFHEDGERILSTWEPEDQFQGFHDVLHGGIQSTLMDEIASWVVFMMLDSAGVTYRIQVRYLKPVHVSSGKVSLAASLSRFEKNLAHIDVKLQDGGGRLCAEGMVAYYVLSREKARKQLRFPGREAFYGEGS